MKQRMRVFAGPNGSGKTALVNQLIREGNKLINPNLHINPDDLNSADMLDFDNFGLKVDENDFQDFVLNHHFYKALYLDINDIKINDNCFKVVKKGSYMGAMLSDYLRDSLIRTNERLFSFETVFSHPSKVDFLENAKNHGWDVYLYFVSTADHEINCARVVQRVLKGEHDVPEIKIRDRYIKTHDNLYPALKHCRRAYIFDNSEDMKLIAEKKPDGSLDFSKEYPVPGWLNECLLSKLNERLS